MKLRTFEGEPVRGELTTDAPVSQNGLPVLLVNGEPFSPEEAEAMIFLSGKARLKNMSGLTTRS